ncbi:hypothetical protein CASFOL_015860 [Castilleja foliolosa]|uniref:Uncharacterized protein n=1 Tax=Castilleja foliolosa TaxID=1961234 RepID=A0ABD3DIR1_9LAMI
MLRSVDEQVGTDQTDKIERFHGKLLCCNPRLPAKQSSSSHMVEAAKYFKEKIKLHQIGWTMYCRMC